MLLISQDELQIIMFDYIKQIRIINKKIVINISNDKIEDEGIVVATYNTQEQAQKILKLLIEKYSEYKRNMLQNNEYKYKMYYKLPKER